MRRDRRWHGGRRAANRRHWLDRPAPQQSAATVGIPAPRAGQAEAAGRDPIGYDAYRADLLGYALRLTGGDAYRAQEVVEKAMCRAGDHPGLAGRRAETIRPWLMVLVRREVLGERQCAAMPAEAAAVAASAASSTVLAALRELSGVHRSVLIGSFYGGRSLEQVAAAEGVPVETVKSRLFHALRALRDAVQQGAG